MSARQPVEVTGVVVELLPHAMVRVELDGGHRVQAHLAGGVQRNFVRVLVGDRVLVQLSPHDLGRGRVVRRLEGEGRV
jgi:translation initiation factor IF-1